MKKGPERFMFGLFKSAKLPDLVGRPFGRKREFPFEHLGFEEDKFEKVWNCHFRPTEKNNQPHESKKKQNEKKILALHLKHVLDLI